PFVVCLSRHGHHRELHSFPTRRSSDLWSRGLGVRRILCRPELADPLRRQPLREACAQQLTVPIAGETQRHHTAPDQGVGRSPGLDRKSTRLNSSHVKISYAVFCLKKKK